MLALHPSWSLVLLLATLGAQLQALPLNMEVLESMEPVHTVSDQAEKLRGTNMTYYVPSVSGRVRLPATGKTLTSAAPSQLADQTAQTDSVADNDDDDDDDSLLDKIEHKVKKVAKKATHNLVTNTKNAANFTGEVLDEVSDQTEGLADSLVNTVTNPKGVIQNGTQTIRLIKRNPDAALHTIYQTYRNESKESGAAQTTGSVLTTGATTAISMLNPITSLGVTVASVDKHLGIITEALEKEDANRTATQMASKQAQATAQMMPQAQQGQTIQAPVQQQAAAQTAQGQEAQPQQQASSGSTATPVVQVASTGVEATDSPSSAATTSTTPAAVVTAKTVKTEAQIDSPSEAKPADEEDEEEIPVY